MTLRAFIVFPLCGLLIACGQPNDDRPAPKRSGKTTPAAKDTSKITPVEPAKNEPLKPGDSAKTSDQPLQNSQLRQDSNSAQDSKPGQIAQPTQTAPPASTTLTAKPEATKPSIEKAPLLLTLGKLKIETPEYQIPEKVRARIQKYQPEILPPKSPDFEIRDQHLTINAVDKLVTFNGVLHVKNNTPEAFELQCSIDTASTPWICQDMTPTDENLAAQKRYQGTFKCLDTYVCDSVGVALWVVIDGKLQEPKLFQAHGFRIRRATSGDEDEDLMSVPEAEARIANEEKMQDRVPQEPDSKPEKTTVQPHEPAPSQTPAPPVAKPQAPPRAAAPAPLAPAADPSQLTDEEVEALLDDPEASIEISEPLTMPNPSVGKFSVPGIEKLPAQIGPGVKVQAVGWHTRGVLQRPSEFPAAGPGFISRDHGSKDYGTALTVSLLSRALGNVSYAFPNRPPVILGQVAKPAGGKILNHSGKAHASHQTGLDADVGLPSTSTVNDFFSACGKSRCGKGNRVTERFDVQRFWHFVKQVSCAENKPVIAMFIHPDIKRNVCQYVRSSKENLNDACVRQALQSLRNESSHDTHVHVRLRCPENTACQNSWVTLVNGTGC